MLNADEILDVTQAAAHLRMSARTLQRLEAKGKGPKRIQLSVARVVYLRGDLDVWMTAKSTAAVSAAG